MNILVTGASGFVGRHLIEYLSQKVDCQITAWTTKKTFEHLPRYKNVQWYQQDIRSKENVDEFFKTKKFDHVYHIAGIAAPNLKEYELYYKTNVLGTLNIIDAIHRNSPEAIFLIVSSSLVYGKIRIEDNPIKETATLSPFNHYAASKAAMELAVLPYVEKGLKLVIARPFNHTGPSQDCKYVCSDFAKQFALMKIGKKAPVLSVGNIDVVRDFLDVRDVVKAYESLMSSSIYGDVVNVCSGAGVSLRTIIKLLEEISGVRVEIEQQLDKLRSIDAQKIIGSNEKIKQNHGWTPEITIKQTLKELYEYWLEKVKNA